MHGEKGFRTPALDIIKRSLRTEVSMNDLTISPQFQESLPTVVEGLHRAQNIFESIQSFEDIERVFLKGAGLSPNTYRAYLEAVKQLYDFTDGLNPLQIQPRHIEAFYDDLVKHADRNTAYLRIAGLKRFFKGIRSIIPFYTSPFELMNEKLKKKLSRTKKGNRTKKALNLKETRGMLKYLKSDISLQGKQNYAIVFMLVTSGLRAFELLQLQHKDIEPFEGKYTARFIGKGDKEAEQEIYEPALKACIEYFRTQFNRKPKPEDYLFYTIPRYPGEPVRPLHYQTMYNHIEKVGVAVRKNQIITRNLQFTAHLFRRTYATLLYKKGMRVKAIQKLTRHASLDTLMKHYIDDSEPAAGYLDSIYAV